VTTGFQAIKARIEELVKKPIDKAAVEAKLKKMLTEGLPRLSLDRDYIIEHKEEILDRVQKRAEEYEQVSGSCAKASALSVIEEFGLGNMEVITALTAFPGIAVTGETCGGIVGGLAALSLYFGNQDPTDLGANARTIVQGRKLVTRFQEILGTTKCYNIHKDVVFGRYYDMMDQQGFSSFLRDNGREKCGLPPGIGARLAAEIIIESMEEAKAKGR
jgi:C_GCAxxG_C_C family probable redox protein